MTVEKETTVGETSPGVDDVDNSTEAEIPIKLNKLGCGSSLGGGLAVMISVSVAGFMLCKRKKE